MRRGGLGPQARLLQQLTTKSPGRSREVLPGLVPPPTTAVLLGAPLLQVTGGGLCSDQSEIWSLFLPRAQSWLNPLWASCPWMTRCPQRSPEPPAVGADGGDPQSRERRKPELLLGAMTNVSLGKHLPFFLRPRRARSAPPALQGVPAKGPAVCSVQKPRSFSEGRRLGRGLGSPSLCTGRGAPGNMGVSPLRPRPPWLVVVGGWSRRGKWSPVQGELVPPRNASHGLCNA